VRTILEGSVRRSGNRIRVTAQLIKAQDGYHLWSQRYDREMADVFEVQDEIAAAIAGALQVRLSPKPAGERYRPCLPAYEACLRGRHHQFKLIPGSWEKAKECCEQAIALDPKFALAYAELAGLFNQATFSGVRPPQEIVPLNCSNSFRRRPARDLNGTREWRIGRCRANDAGGKAVLFTSFPM